MVISARRSYSFQRSTALLSLLQTLDNYLALARRRPQGAFSQTPLWVPGDFRRRPYGGFEYRTLPSFRFPLVAKVSLYVAYLALDTAIVCWRGHSIRSVTIAPIMKATSPCLKNVSQAGTGIYQRAGIFGLCPRNRTGACSHGSGAGLG